MSILQEQAIQLIGSLPDDRRIGIAEGKFVVPDDIDECNDEIAEMFGVNE
jgi:uncharacterized protein YlzI (FlbEa/FlbD family)